MDALRYPVRRVAYGVAAGPVTATVRHAWRNSGQYSFDPRMRQSSQMKRNGTAKFQSTRARAGVPAAVDVSIHARVEQTSMSRYPL